MCSTWGEEFASDTERNGHLLCSGSVVAVVRLQEWVYEQLSEITGGLCLCFSEHCASIMHSLHPPAVPSNIYTHFKISFHKHIWQLERRWWGWMAPDTVCSLWIAAVPFTAAFFMFLVVPKIFFWGKMERRVLEVIFLQFLKYSKECHSVPEACSCSFKIKVYVACPWRWQESTGDSKPGGKWLNDTLGWRDPRWAQFCSSCLKQPVPGVKLSPNYAPVLSWMEVVGSC